MAFLFETRPFSEESRRTAILDLLENARPDRDFYILVVGAALFALCGIALDSLPVLIGAMIVAPLAAPILALGLGLSVGDLRLAARSLSTLMVASLLAAVVTAVVAHFLPPFTINGTFISFVAHPFYDIAIALIAGAIAAYGHVRAKVGGALTGIGVAVSLMPPLVASALALSILDLSLFREASLIFVFNVGGILAGSIIILITFGTGKNYRDIGNKDPM
ncbi:MAG: TIGR00341 family protein [Patescibacteria group bacterium]